MCRRLLVLGMVLGMVPRGAAHADEALGVVEGQISYAGKPPQMPELARFLSSGKPRDAACATHEAARWVFVKDGGVADVLVRLPVGAAHTPPPTSPATVDQKNCIYVPRVVGIVAGQKIAYKNSDATMHNIHTYAAGAEDFNVAQPVAAADLIAEVPAAPGGRPYRVTCDVHPWMEAFVVVTDHRYFAVTGDDGRFRFEAPPGLYAIEAWHPNLGAKTVKVKIVAGKTVVAKLPPYKASDYQPPRDARGAAR